MKALVYHALGKMAVEERPIPELKAPGDAIVRFECGVLNGKVAPGKYRRHRPTDALCH